MLYGGGGRDTLKGGAGKDGFLFDAPIGPGLSDSIIDFNAADDTIWLNRTVFGGISASGVLAAGAFQVGAAALDADDRLVYDQGTGRIWYDADGSGATAAIEIAVVSAGLVLTNADFMGYI